MRGSHKWPRLLSVANVNLFAVFRWDQGSGIMTEYNNHRDIRQSQHDE